MRFSADPITRFSGCEGQQPEGFLRRRTKVPVQKPQKSDRKLRSGETAQTASFSGREEQLGKSFCQGEGEKVLFFLSNLVLREQQTEEEVTDSR